MSDLQEKVQVVQSWLDELRQDRPANPPRVNVNETVLTQVLEVIQQSAAGSGGPDVSQNYADLERQVQKQTVALTRATNALKRQITQRETAAQKLRKAYNDLEVHLQDHIAYQSKLNQRLQEQIEEEKRTQVGKQEEKALSEALRDTLATMSSTVDLDKILDHILDTVKRVTPYDGANILFVESDLVHVVRQRGYQARGLDKDWLNQRIPITKLAVLQQLMDVGKSMAIPDTTTSPLWIGFPNLAWVNSNVIAPIRSNGKILGFLSLDSATPGYFTEVHAERLQTFADQAAIAIQNARLLERAKRAAILAERNRLANELHDTISQTLWSMSLLTERISAIWEIDQEEGRRSLLTLHLLAQNALGEMRSLLLELSPSALTKGKLGDLIRQAAEVISNRTALSISVTVENQEPIPPDVHFALYRVVQEALNNVVLHAQANKVEVYFNSDGRRVELSVHDNGVGFDPSEIGIGHLGLSIMNDRIKSIGGTLETSSHKGEGSRIRVVWIAPTA